MLRAVLASYPRRQQLRRLTRAARSREAPRSPRQVQWRWRASTRQRSRCVSDWSPLLGLASRRALRLAERSRVNAESEAQVRRALKPLAAEGWRIRHAVDWPGRGDLDHVVRSPSGMGFVIETKTLRYSHAHLARTIDATRWLARRRRHYPRGVVPVVCVARARSLERPVGTLLIVSLDRLLPALRAAAAAESVARRSTGGRPERSALQSGAPSESRTVGRASPSTHQCSHSSESRSRLRRQDQNAAGSRSRRHQTSADPSSTRGRSPPSCTSRPSPPRPVEGAPLDALTLRRVDAGVVGSGTGTRSVLTPIHDPVLAPMRHRPTRDLLRRCRTRGNRLNWRVPSSGEGASQSRSKPGRP